MSDTHIDPQIVINDLLEQIKRLTLDNAMLRAYINREMASQDNPPLSAVLAGTEPTSD